MTTEEQEDSYKELQEIKLNFTVGYLTGIVIGSCWGLFYGPFQLTAADTSAKKITMSMLRYQRQSLLRLPPMSALVRVTAGYLDSHGYNQLTSMSAQIAVCFAYLTIIKFPK